MKSNMKLNNSGQVEIMGLIMITVIAGIIMAFALVFTFSVTERQEFQHEKFGERVIASNFVTVIAKTYVSECDTDFTTLVKDCASEYDSTALDNVGNVGGYEQGKITCYDQTGIEHHSCHFVNITSNNITRQTLDAWQTSYIFKIETGTSKVLNITNLDCTANKEKESRGRQIVPLYPRPGEAFIILEVCKS